MFCIVSNCELVFRLCLYLDCRHFFLILQFLIFFVLPLFQLLLNHFIWLGFSMYFFSYLLFLGTFSLIFTVSRYFHSDIYPVLLLGTFSWICSVTVFSFCAIWIGNDIIIIWLWLWKMQSFVSFIFDKAVCLFLEVPILESF